jgi:hypothetical protein
MSWPGLPVPVMLKNAVRREGMPAVALCVTITIVSTFELLDEEVFDREGRDRVEGGTRLSSMSTRRPVVPLAIARDAVLLLAAGEAKGKARSFDPFHRLECLLQRPLDEREPRRS